MQISVLVQPNVKLHWANPEGIPNETRMPLSKTFGRTEDNDLAQFRLIVELFS